MRATVGSAAAPAARCRNCRRGSFIFEPPSPFTSFDHLVGAKQDRGRQLDADRLGGLGVDDELQFGRKLDREIGGGGALQYLVNVTRSATKARIKINSIANEAPGLHVFAITVDSGQIGKASCREREENAA